MAHIHGGLTWWSLSSSFHLMQCSHASIDLMTEAKRLERTLMEEAKSDNTIDEK